MVDEVLPRRRVSDDLARAIDSRSVADGAGPQESQRSQPLLRAVEKSFLAIAGRACGVRISHDLAGRVERGGRTFHVTRLNPQVHQGAVGGEEIGVTKYAGCRPGFGDVPIVIDVCNTNWSWDWW